MLKLRTMWRSRCALALLTALALLLTALPLAAQSTTLFSDDFEDGNSTGWSTSGGSWSVTADGTKVYRQGGTSADARALAGSSWGDQSVQARVKPISFNGSDRFVAVLARVQSSTSYYYLALRSSGTLELKKLSSGSSTTLASKSFSVSTGSWYTLRLEARGSTLTGYVNGAQQLSATDTAFASGKIGLATFYASASFDDVLVTMPGTTVTPTPVTPTPVTATPITPTPVTVTPVTPTPCTNPADGPVGFAAVSALGQSGTTGGAGGQTVTVSNATEFVAAVKRTEPLIIQVNGTIALSSMQKVTSNKTIVGVGTSGKITGGGLNISAVSNVIIRNLTFADLKDDAINVQDSAHHIWIDHNDLSNAYDGLVDIKRGSDYVTVSWNHTHNHSKTMLLGHDDGNGSQDKGHLRVTYHHNFFDGTDQRHPRVRFGEPVHVFNNYYLNNGLYGVASTAEAGVLVEGNYFENVAYPTYTLYGDSTVPGRLVERNNVYVNSGTPQVLGAVVEPSTYYRYTLDNPSSIPAIVRAGAGVGKLGGGSPGCPTVTPTPVTPTPVTPTPVTPTPVTVTPVTPTPITPSGLFGFATLSALGQSGTTGGAGGPVVTVSSASEFLDYIARPGPYVIQVQGAIALPGPMHDVTSDKTIIGLGSSAKLTGGGLNIGLPIDNAITSPPANAVKNVIVRNLTITSCPDDCINVQMFSHHIWIDHNDLSFQYDGALDIKRGSDYVTVSWNRFHDSDKNSLVGHDDSNGAQDIGRLKITYHHNFFDGSKQRNPRVRFAEPLHILNNYFLNITGYGVASQMNAGVYVEGNYFDNVEKPTRNDVGGDPGRIAAVNNINVNTEDPIVTSGSVISPATFYRYTVDDPASLPTTVRNGAGVGKIGN
jgi:pectate lyase